MAPTSQHGTLRSAQRLPDNELSSSDPPSALTRGKEERTSAVAEYGPSIKTLWLPGKWSQCLSMAKGGHGDAEGRTAGDGTSGHQVSPR